MTRDPKTIGPDALVASALEILNAASITALFVVERKKPVGIVHLHDLLQNRRRLILHLSSLPLTVQDASAQAPSRARCRRRLSP